MTFKVDARHPLYEAMVRTWRKVRDCMRGEDAIKANAKDYIPRLSGHDQTVAGEAAYQSYVQRGTFYGALGRTVFALVGLLMRKAPAVRWPDGNDLYRRCTKENESFDVLLGEVLRDVISVGRVALLVDASLTPNADPYVVSYKAENLINWEVGMVGSRSELIEVVFAEKRRDRQADGSWKEVDQYRVYKLGVPHYQGDEESDKRNQVFAQEAFQGILPGDMGPAGVCYVETWEKRKAEDGQREHFALTSLVVPRRRGGAPLQELPIVIINAEGIGAKPCTPPMNDFANLNLSHGRNSFDLEHGLHYTSIPTPYAAGFEVARGEVLEIGATTAWVSGDPQAKAGYLEFSGAGLQKIMDVMAKKEEQMGVLGARLLQPEKAGVESADAYRMRQAGERSVLAMVSDQVSEGASRVLRILLHWVLPGSRPEELLENAAIELTKDFEVARMPPQELAALFQIYQGGGMSFDSFFWNLQRGEVFPETTTVEEERQRIEIGGPGSMLPSEPDAVSTSKAGNPSHTHQWVPGASQTSESGGHVHEVMKTSAGYTVKAWGTAETAHTHTLPSIEDVGP